MIYMNSLHFSFHIEGSLRFYKICKITYWNQSIYHIWGQVLSFTEVSASIWNTQDENLTHYLYNIDGVLHSIRKQGSDCILMYTSENNTALTSIKCNICKLSLLWRAHILSRQTKDEMVWDTPKGAHFTRLCVYFTSSSHQYFLFC